MSKGPLRNEPEVKATAGAAWVDRFLLPLFAQRFPGQSSLSCLQLVPDDPTEAARLAECGHHCEMQTPDLSLEIKAPAASYDFVFIGRFPALARTESKRVGFAREIHRVLRPGGSLLLVAGNRWGPLDLSRNGSLIHGLGSSVCLSRGDAARIFVEEARFAGIEFLNVAGHFGWNRLPRTLRLFGHLADLYWRRLAKPGVPWLYFGPFNPTLILWINKA